MSGISKGDTVEWSYGKGKAEGTVEQRFTEKVTKTIKGKKITRDASKEEPAVLVKAKTGSKALKSESEVHKKKAH